MYILLIAYEMNPRNNLQIIKSGISTNYTKFADKAKIQADYGKRHKNRIC